MVRNVHEKRAERQLLLILLPSLALLLAFVIYPALYSVYLSFTNEALTGAAALRPRFVGIRNYARLLNDAKFWNSLLVTFFFVLGSAVIGQFVLGLVSAIALRRNIRFRQIFSSIILLPNAAPEVVAGFMWISMLAGGEQATLSRIVSFFGVTPADWLQVFPLSMIIIVNTWRGIATAMILLTAGLSTIPTEIYEAARMDGATPSQMFRRITLPLMMPTILLYMLISAVSTIAVFGLVYALTRGGPGGATELVSIYIYNQSFTAFQLGYGAAVAVVVLLISLDPRHWLCPGHEGECLTWLRSLPPKTRKRPLRSACLRNVVADLDLLRRAFLLGAACLARWKRAAVPALAGAVDVRQLHARLHQGRWREMALQFAVRGRQRDRAGDGAGGARRLCAVADPGLVEAAFPLCDPAHPRAAADGTRRAALQGPADTEQCRRRRASARSSASMRAADHALDRLYRRLSRLDPGACRRCSCRSRCGS